MVNFCATCVGKFVAKSFLNLALSDHSGRCHENQVFGKIIRAKFIGAKFKKMSLHFLLEEEKFF